jgi:hypothetical protein
MANYNSGHILSALTDAAKIAYQDGLIRDIWVASAGGLPELVKSRAERYAPGGRVAHFLLDIGPAASVINTGEKGRLPGRDSAGLEKVTTNSYDSYRLALRFEFGTLQSSEVALKLASTGQNQSVRYMLDTWKRDLKGILKTFGTKFAVNFWTGANGYLWRLDSSSPVSQSSGSYYRVNISTSPGSREFLADGRLLHRNIPIEIVDTTTGLIAETNAHGVIVTAEVDYIIILINGGQTLSGPSGSLANYDSDHAIRWQRRAAEEFGNYEPYGMANLVGSGTWPIDATNEQTIDPVADRVLEWRSYVNTALSSGNASVKDLDAMLRNLVVIGGFDFSNMDESMMVVTSPGVLEKLTQEMTDYREVMAGDRPDLRPMGQIYHYSGTPIRWDRLLSNTGLMYGFRPIDLATSDLGMEGPQFSVNNGGLPGAQTIGYLDPDVAIQSTRMMRLGNMGILKRNCSGVVTDLE